MDRALRMGLLLACMTCIAASRVRAAESDELDNAKWKLDANAWVSAPTGSFRGENGNGSFDLQRDFGFGNYVTFSGNVDWRFKRKHHFLLSVEPVISSRTTTIARTITWKGETYDLGSMVKADIQSLVFSPGYQYDIFRRRRWALGVQANVNLIYTQASLQLAGSVSQGGGSTSNSSERTGTFFAPLPAIGPVGHVYPLHSWEHFHIDGGFTGMSFFGYGNYYSAYGMAAFPVARNWDVRAGYLLGSRLKITGSSNQIGIQLTQKGPNFGVEYHWGIR